MKAVRLWPFTAAVGLVVSFLAGAGPAAAAGPPPPRVALQGSLVPAIERSHPAGSVPAHSLVSFGVVLSLRDAPGRGRSSGRCGPTGQSSSTAT